MALPRSPRDNDSHDEIDERISREMSQLLARESGRGPVHTRTHHNEEFALVILEGVLSRAEQTLLAGGSVEAVRSIRRALHDAIRPDLIAVVEAATGQSVMSSLSELDNQTGTAVEVFLFHRP